GDPNFPGNVKGVTVGVIFKINPRIEFNPGAGMVLENVLVGNQRMNGLQMVGQSIVVADDSAASAPRYEQTIRPIVATEIKPLVLGAKSQIPVSSNQEPMGIGKIVVERIAVTELPVVVFKIAVEGIGGFVIEDLGRVLVLVGGRRGRFFQRRFGSGKGQRSEANKRGGLSEGKGIYKFRHG